MAGLPFYEIGGQPMIQYVKELKRSVLNGKSRRFFMRDQRNIL